MSGLDELVAVKEVLGRGWLDRGARGGVTAMGRLRNVTEATARAPYAVHGIGVGFKEVAGARTTTLALRVYVVQKVARRALAAADRIPEHVDGLPVDIVEAPPAFVASTDVPGLRQPRDPMCAGISIGCNGVTFGTLGAFCRSVRPEERDRILLLSNRHVLVGSPGQTGSPIFQPGPGEAAAKPRQVGALLRAWAIQPGIIANRIDAAVATVSGAKHALTLPGDAGHISSTGPAQHNTIVCKFGRTTGLTEGVITDVNCTSVVGLAHADSTRTATFIGQIRIDRRGGAMVFADRGDSGAVILEQGVGRVVGLYFAGPIDGSFGLANHIADVTERLQIELLT